MPNGNGLFAEYGSRDLAAPFGLAAVVPGFAGAAASRLVFSCVPSTFAASAVRCWCVQLRVIANYNPSSEPEHGYLGADAGMVVLVMPGTQAPADPRTKFKCDYVFALLAQEPERHRGWLSVDILDSNM